MSKNGRKWNSMERLDDTGGFLSPEGTTNLRSLKHLSVSTPGISLKDMDAESELEEILSPVILEEDDEEDAPAIEESSQPTDQPAGPHKARQKKFDRQFGINETVVEFYSCALALDILLHGILYVTNHHFAFYSNVFGKVTKVTIPVTSVEQIHKVKTAFFIPNAIHVLTSSEKYVFTSFMSRENAFTQMQRVWDSLMSKSCGSKITPIEPPADHHQEEVSPKSKKKKLSKRDKSSSFESSKDKDLKQGISEKKSNKQEKENKLPQPTFKSHLELNGEADKAVLISQTKLRKISKASTAETVTSDEETRAPFTDRIPGFGTFNEIDPKQFHNIPQPMGVVRPKKPVPSRTDVIILRLCYFMIILLSISAVNLYFSIDAIIAEGTTAEQQQQVPSVSGDLLQQQKTHHASVSLDFLQRLNETIKRINKVHGVLEQISTGYVGVQDDNLLRMENAS